MTEIKNPDPLLNPKEAARYIKKAPGTLANWRSAKRYPINIVKQGRSVHYRQSDLDKWLSQSLVVIRPE